MIGTHDPGIHVEKIGGCGVGQAKALTPRRDFGVVEVWAIQDGWNLKKA